MAMYDDPKQMGENLVAPLTGAAEWMGAQARRIDPAALKQYLQGVLGMGAGQPAGPQQGPPAGGGGGMMPGLAEYFQGQPAPGNPNTPVMPQANEAMRRAQIAAAMQQAQQNAMPAGAPGGTMMPGQARASASADQPPPGVAQALIEQMKAKGPAYPAGSNKRKKK